MIHICGRKVKVQTGPKSQTVKICSSTNIRGQYDWIVRLHPPLISIEKAVGNIVIKLIRGGLREGQRSLGCLMLDTC